MVAIAQRSFAGGEIAPALYARTDLVRYATGLRTCRNFIVQRHGGATNRPGLVFINEAKDSTVACRLIPFVLDATDVADTYVLELGNGYIRFYQDGGRLTVSGVTAWANATTYVVGDLVSRSGTNYYCISAHTSATATDRPGDGSAWQTRWYALTGSVYEIPTPYTTADLAAINFVQSGDVITLVHPGYAPRELRRTAHTTWTLTAITFGPSIAAPTNVAATGGSAGARRYWAVTAIKEGTLEESLAGLFDDVDTVPSSGTPASISWNQVAGAISYNVYRSNDGLTYGLINSAGGNPIATEDTSWTDQNESATSSVDGVWASAAGQCRNPLASISATNRAYDGKYIIRGRYTLTGNGPGVTRGSADVYYSRDGEARVFAGQTEIFEVVGATISGPTAFELTIDVPDNGYATLQIDIVPSVLPSSAGTNATMNVSTGSSPDNAVAWYSGATGFTDEGDTPDYSQGPPSHPAVFAAPGDYPSSVGYFQERLFLGGSLNEPEKTRGSRIGSYKSFAVSTPLQADDAIAWSVLGRRVNAVRHLIDLGKLVVFGTGAAHVVDGDDAGTLRPDAINPKKAAANGCGTVAPVEVDDSAIFLQGRGRQIRDLKPVPNTDSYAGTDLTIMAAHLFEGRTIVDMAYQEDPNSVIWCVRSDGVLLGLTYIKDQAIWGWHRHDTQGTIENVCVVPEGDEDAVYVVVKRTIDGATVRYIERMASRYVADIVDAIFMDAALSYDGWHTGVTTMQLSGGTDYLSTEQLTLTASSATFSSGDVGNAVFLEDADGNLVRLTIEAFTSSTVVSVRSDRTVSAALRAAIGNGNGRWALAVDSVSGLDHLEGEAVAVLGDGYVESSPNNTVEHPTPLTVSGGAITLSRPYAVIHVGLPYLADLETLDLDSPGPRSVKDKKQLVNQVIAFVKETRGLWAGRPDKVTTAAPLNGLQPPRDRSQERANETYDTPPAIITDAITVSIDNNWNNNGRVLYRQPDPLPATILSAAAVGYIA